MRLCVVVKLFGVEDMAHQSVAVRRWDGEMRGFGEVIGAAEGRRCVDAVRVWIVPIICIGLLWGVLKWKDRPGAGRERRKVH